MRRYAAGSLVLLLLTVGTSIPESIEAALITVDGVCTLNAAIVAANEDRPAGSCPAGSGPDTIQLVQSVVLQVVDNTINGPSGLPSVTSTITIEGNGFAVVRDRTMEPFRIFHVGSGGDLTLRSLLIAFGRAVDFSGGGGIFVRSGGRVRLVDCDVIWNDARNIEVASGGGIEVHGEALIERSRITENEAEPAEFLTDNATSFGGGIYVGGTAIVRSSVIEKNRALVPGAVIGGNAEGGGIYVGSRGWLELTDSTLDRNSAEAIYSEGGGLASPWGFLVRILRSTISGNIAYGPQGATGGGISARSTGFEIENSTISGNRVVADRWCRGGGVYGIGSIRHTTFYGNKADEGAAIWAFDLGQGVSVSGSLFAESDGDHCAGTVYDLGGGNLADDSTCVPTIGSGLIGLDPILADNGGPTLTHELLPESTAIDIAGDCGLVTDQRGAARAGPCDSGAFEEIGCDLVEIENTTIEQTGIYRTCSTFIFGPGVVIDSEFLTFQAGDLITLRDGVEVSFRSDLALVVLSP